MRILAIGDSLSLPGHSNEYEDTWSYLIKKRFPAFDHITLFRSAITSKILVEEGGGSELFPLGSDCLEHFRPNIVILQLGILDCAPRLFRKNSLLLKLIKHLPKSLSRSVLDLFKKYRRRSTKRSYVSLSEFTRNFQNFFDRCAKNQVVKVIAIAIPFPGSKMIQKNPEIISAINLYNERLKKLSDSYSFLKIVNPLDQENSKHGIYHDGYHPNPKGNELVFHSLTEVLKLYDK